MNYYKVDDKGWCWKYRQMCPLFKGKKEYLTGEKSVWRPVKVVSRGVGKSSFKTGHYRTRVSD